MVDTRAKPRNRLEHFQRLVEDVRSKTFAYIPRDKKTIDWARYTDAQIFQTHDTLKLLTRTIDQINEPPAPSGRGPKHKYSAKDRAKTIILKEYFHVGNRGAQGMALLFQEKIGLEKVPHYKAIERAYGDERVRIVLAAAFEKTTENAARKATCFSLDGSGLPTSIKQNWERDKGGKDAYRFDGSITMLGLPAQVIVAHHDVPIGFTAEAPFLPLLVDRTVAQVGHLKGRVVCADAGFISRGNCDAIADAGGVPRIFPKKNLTMKSKGSAAWAPMLTGFLRDPQSWLREYHQRSLSESGWSTYKRMFPRPLRTRILGRRVCERRSRFLVYNLVRLARLHRHRDLEAPQFTN